MSDTWQSTREGWNRELKCAREACKASLSRRAYEHPTTGLWYCVSCARQMMEWQGPPPLVMPEVGLARRSGVLPLRAGLDLIMDECDRMLWRGDKAQTWPELVAVLVDPEWKNASLEALISVMIVTLAVKDRVKERELIAQIIREKNPDESEATLKGLV